MCLLPDLGPSSRGLTLASLTLHTHGNTTQGFQLYVYDVVDPMHVTSLSGCGEQTSEVVGGIPTAGELCAGRHDRDTRQPLSPRHVSRRVLQPGLRSLSVHVHGRDVKLAGGDAACWRRSAWCSVRPSTSNVMTSTASVISNPLALVFTPPSRSCSDDSSSSSSSGIPSVGSSGVSSSGAGSGSSGSSSASMIAVSSSSSGAGMASSDRPQQYFVGQQQWRAVSRRSGGHRHRRAHHSTARHCHARVGCAAYTAERAGHSRHTATRRTVSHTR